MVICGQIQPQTSKSESLLKPQKINLVFNPVFMKFDKGMFSWINLNHNLSGLSKTLLIAEQS
jgi:hypothetical protein